MASRFCLDKWILTVHTKVINFDISAIRLICFFLRTIKLRFSLLILSLLQIIEDPNQVNIHQFYPELKHQFMKSTDVQIKQDTEVFRLSFTGYCIYHKGT